MFTHEVFSRGHLLAYFPFVASGQDRTDTQSTDACDKLPSRKSIHTLTLLSKESDYRALFFPCPPTKRRRLGKDGPQESQKYQDVGSDDPERVTMKKFVYLLNPLKPATAPSEQFKIPIFVIVRR
jgi:hypothetical protein